MPSGRQPVLSHRMALCASIGMGSIFAPAISSQAAILVKESYNYALTSGATMSGVTTSAQGLTGNYAVTSGDGTARFEASGLTFGTLPSSGGAARLGASDNQYVILGAKLNAGTVIGTVYQSFFFKTTTNTGTGASSGTFTRLADSISGSTNDRLAVLGETRSTGSTVGIGYNGSSSAADASGAPALNTTYLFLARFTNVGANTALSPGNATLWVFTPAAFGNWAAAGQGLESNLGAYATLTATETQTSGAFSFNNSTYLHLATTTTGTGYGTSVTYYDELRLGTALTDVIPEPASLGLAVLSSTALLGRRKRTGRSA